MAEYAKDVLVDTQWVEDHLSDETVRIVEVDENPALYAEAHIPGAIGFDWKKDLQDQVKRDFLGPDGFGELFGSHGVGNDHTVVLYGDRNNWFAAYTYWYLKYYGHHNWTAEDREDCTVPLTALRLKAFFHDHLRPEATPARHVCRREPPTNMLNPYQLLFL